MFENKSWIIKLKIILTIYTSTLQETEDRIAIYASTLQKIECIKGNYKVDNIGWRCIKIFIVTYNLFSLYGGN